ncbi:hypothetical protein [Paenisporosarcina sp. TG-14]|uniref:hypothetical protein n=1 Tax=Paenisporosarcina sp. TG-14 TaxID=1231057 RepID=UPI00037D2974|nr:hypothetical protein [Paenisporosarcina sp. TG-14]
MTELAQKSVSIGSKLWHRWLISMAVITGASIIRMRRSPERPPHSYDWFSDVRSGSQTCPSWFYFMAQLVLELVFLQKVPPMMNFDAISDKIG